MPSFVLIAGNNLLAILFSVSYHFFYGVVQDVTEWIFAHEMCHN